MKIKFKTGDKILKNSNWNFKGNVYKYFDKHIKSLFQCIMRHKIYIFK